MATFTPPIDVLTASLQWSVFYSGVFFASRLLAPLAFTHCAKLDSTNLSYWAESVVSTANAIVLTPMAIKASLELALFDLSTPFTVSSPLTVFACAAMIGYTIWDLFTIIYYRKEWGGFEMYIVHHFGSISAWGLCAVTGYAHVIAVPALLMEVTGPFVNGRYFLSTAGLKDTTLYTVNGVMMFLTFLIFRVVFNWWLYLSRFWWQFSLMWQCPVALVICFNLLYPVNLTLQMIWFSKITKGIIAVLKGKGESKKET